MDRISIVLSKCWLSWLFKSTSRHINSPTGDELCYWDGLGTRVGVLSSIVLLLVSISGIVWWAGVRYSIASYFIHFSCSFCIGPWTDPAWLRRRKVDAGSVCSCIVPTSLFETEGLHRMDPMIYGAFLSAVYLDARLMLMILLQHLCSSFGFYFAGSLVWIYPVLHGLVFFPSISSRARTTWQFEYNAGVRLIGGSTSTKYRSQYRQVWHSAINIPYWWFRCNAGAWLRSGNRDSRAGQPGGRTRSRKWFHLFHMHYHIPNIQAG